MGPNAIWNSPGYLAVSTQQGFLCWLFARSDLRFGMMLSPALGQINGTSFDFVPYDRRYLTAGLLGFFFEVFLSQALNVYVPFTKLFHRPIN